MSCVPTELMGEYPGDVSRILEMESENQTFMDLAEAYETVTIEIQGIETGIDPVCEAYHAQLLRQREEIRKILHSLLDA